MVILFLALLSFVPVAGDFARLIIMLFALQIMWGYRSPVLPHRVRMRKISSRHLTRLPAITFSALTHLEKSIRPRWSPMLNIRRVAGVVLFLVCLASFLIPLPFANIPAAAVIALMALAYLEYDGLLLLIAEIAGLGLIAMTLVILFAAARL